MSFTNKSLRLEGDRREYLLKGLTEGKEKLDKQLDRWIAKIKTEETITPNSNHNLFNIIKRLEDTEHWLNLL